MNSNSNSIVISGPSASGKSTLIKKLLDNSNYFLSISHTTRSPRKGEINGKDYFFVSKEQFIKLIKEDLLLEYTVYNDNYYGTTFSQVQSNKVFDIEYEGVDCFKRKYPYFKYIFIDCEKEIVRNRLKKRGEKEEDIEERMKVYDKFQSIKWMFDKVIDNSKGIEESFRELSSFIV